MAGRPTDYCEETALKICEELSEGRSLRSICKDEGMPVMSTVCLWLTKHKEFSEQYDRAREIQAHNLFDETLEIADSGENDTYLDDDGNKRTDHDVISRSRLRVDTRKWYLSKVLPKVYGEKIQQEVSGPEGGPVSVVQVYLPEGGR